MKLPLHLLHRLRRKLRRSMHRLDDPAALRAIEEWTGHRPPVTPRHPMKIPAILLLVAAIVACLFLSSCSDFRLAGLSVETPYGTITSDKHGSTTVTLRPIVIPEK